MYGGGGVLVRIGAEYLHPDCAISLHVFMAFSLTQWGIHVPSSFTFHMGVTLFNDYLYNLLDIYRIFIFKNVNM